MKLLLCFLLSTQFLLIQASEPQLLKEKLGNYLTTIEAQRFSGSVLVEYNGQVLIANGYGKADREKGIENTSKTIFDIGSVTKQFTAAAILKLEMQGKLTVEDKLSKYFKSIPKDKSEITIHHLLTHTSGLIDQVGMDYDEITEIEFLSRLMSEKLLFKVGEQFEYSDSGYSLLALIVERVSKVTYENYLYQNLFLPIGMEQTGYTRPKFAEDSIAVGYKHDQYWGKPTDKKWDVDAPYINLKGAGGLLSSVEDLYKWHKALLSNDILSASAKSKMFDLQVPDGEIFYGYGWYLGNIDYNVKNPKNLINHNGGNHVFFCDFWRLIDEKVTIIIQSNNYDNYTGYIASELANMVLNSNYLPAKKRWYREVHEMFLNGLSRVEVAIEIFKEYKSLGDSDYSLSEESLNDVGYDLLVMKRFDDAVEIFRINTVLYPNSSNVYDSYGEALLEIGKTKDAIRAYKKSLDIDPLNQSAKSVLIKYKSSKKSPEL